jgi:HEAT repeat protein
LGAVPAIVRLKELLADPSPLVHVAAAGAIWRMHDGSGLEYLRLVASDPTPLVKLPALQAEAAQPDATWQATVRELLGNADPQVRLMAAAMIMPVDPEAGRATLAEMLNDPATRQMAERPYLTQAPLDLGTLRRYLTSTTAQARVLAARRLLEVTR